MIGDWYGAIYKHVGKNGLPYSSASNVEHKKAVSEKVALFLKENGISCWIKAGHEMLRVSELKGTLICTKPLEFTFVEDRNLFLLYFNDDFEKFTPKPQYYGTRTV